jgi:hypothetical protein
MGLITAATPQYFRVYHVVGSGDKWSYNLAGGYAGVGYVNTSDPVNGSADTTGADYTQSYSQAGGGVRANSYAFGPGAIIGDQLPGDPVEEVMIAGDSIAFGEGSVAYEGYLGLALGNANIAYHNDALIGVTLLNLCKYDEMGLYLAPYVDDIALNCGSNDLAHGETLAALQGYLETYALTHCLQGANLHIATCLPRTNGIWTSTTGQSLNTWEPIRVAWNNWLRDTTATGAMAQINAVLTAKGSTGKVVQIMDPCLGMEVSKGGVALKLSGKGANQQTATAGGYWGSASGSALTADGVHPNMQGQVKAAAAVVTTSAYWYIH